MDTYEFDGHIHKVETGAFDFNVPITCPKCLDKLRTQRMKLMVKYGWDHWPLPNDAVTKNVPAIYIK